DGAAVKVAAAANERHAVPQRVRLSAPEDDVLVGAHDPLVIVGVEVDRNVAEGPAPVDHTGVVMRVADGDGRDAAERLQAVDNRLIEERQTVPEDVAARGAEKQGPLADGEVRLDADADQVRFLELDRAAVGEPKTV